MHIALHGKAFNNHGGELIASLIDCIKANSIELSVSEEFKAIGNASGLSKLAELPVYRHGNTGQLDFLFSMGGDGTLLEALTHVRDGETPLLGVNMGRLGFLATISPEELLPAVESLIQSNYTIDKRVLLKLESDRDIFKDLSFGLNDFTIVKRDTSSMIVVHTYVDGEFLNAYWADGLIISTPTGSTGYSLSCAGPLVMPHSNNFLITPVSPHNLNVRPMVVADSSVITFKIESRSKNVLIALDSRSATIPVQTTLKISKEAFSACLVKFQDYHPFDTLRQKLNWGLDARN